MRTTRERVEAATREAHLRVIIAALNEWAAEPSDLAKLREVQERMFGYREAAERGLFGPCAAPAVSRHGSRALPPGEMQAALRMLNLTGRQQPTKRKRAGTK